MKYRSNIDPFIYICPSCNCKLIGEISKHNSYKERWSCTNCKQKFFYLKFLPKEQLINFMYYILIVHKEEGYDERK